MSLTVAASDRGDALTADLPLVVDLDGTPLRSDTLIEAFCARLGQDLLGAATAADPDPRHPPMPFAPRQQGAPRAALADLLGTRLRPALPLVGWRLVWMFWLMFGADPFSSFRLKPQLARYLPSYEISTMVLAGWVVVLARERLRLLGMALAGLAATLVFAPRSRPA